MKPPQRRRAAPARYLGKLSGPASWSARQKRQLLRLLHARRCQPEPDAAELARELPDRSEAEVRDFLRHLKDCVAREAIQKVYPGRQRQTPAPIEVWLDLVEKMTGPLEEALMVAFSQVLTIAATEPITLLHSIPPKPTKARGRPVVVSTPAGQEDPTAEPFCPAPKAPSPAPDPLGYILGTPVPVPGAPVDAATKPPGPAPSIPGPAPEIPGPIPSIPGPALEIPGPTPSIPNPAPKMPGPAPERPGPAPSIPGPTLPDPLAPPGDFTVDFEKIYEYLSSLSRSGRGPELSAAESAVVLDLLLALPEELQHLPCGALVQHFSDTYEHLTAPQPDPASAGPPPQDHLTAPQPDPASAGPPPQDHLTAPQPDPASAGPPPQDHLTAPQPDPASAGPPPQDHLTAPQPDPASAGPPPQDHLTAPQPDPASAGPPPQDHLTAPQPDPASAGPPPQDHLTAPQPDPASAGPPPQDHLTAPQPDPASAGPPTQDHLTAPQPDPASVESPPQVTDTRTGPGEQQASPTPSPPDPPGSTEPRDSRSPWQVPGICPLNPFLVPLELLGRTASPPR